MALKKVKNRGLQGLDFSNISQDENENTVCMSSTNSDEDSTSGLTEKETDFESTNEKTQERKLFFKPSKKIYNVISEIILNVENLLPSGVDAPAIPEGITDLVITEVLSENQSFGKFEGMKKIIFTFSNEDEQSFNQTFYVGKTHTNFVKFINDVLGEVPEGEIDLNILKGRKIRAFLYHNYTEGGKGYVNIASCEPIK